jgi:pimeloyl-ACP methyl ester carboxylesterase
VRQSALVFRPLRGLRWTPSSRGLAFEDVMLPCSDGVRVHGWWVPRRGARRAALFLHGTTGNLSTELERVEFLSSLGLDVLAVDYPGYGRSEGRPSPTGCVRAARAAWDFLASRGHAADDVIVYGWSLGAAPAAALAATERVGGLVLHGAFTSLADLIADRYRFLPVRPFVRLRMDCLDLVRRCVAPLLVLHAADDRLVPVSHARRLYAAAAGPRRLEIFPGPHDTMSWRVRQRVNEAWTELIAGRTDLWPRPAAPAQ